jgi:ribosomal protein S27AE
VSAGRRTERDEGAISPPAQLDLFGFHPTPARVVLLPRSGAWRAGHAFGLLLLCWAAIGVVMWLPPHIPWVLAAFFLGIFFFVKYIRERNTLVELDGTCPRCGAAQTIRKPTRLGVPHRVYCPKCRQMLLLRTTEPHSAP